MVGKEEAIRLARMLVEDDVDISVYDDSENTGKNLSSKDAGSKDVAHILKREREMLKMVRKLKPCVDLQ